MRKNINVLFCSILGLIFLGTTAIAQDQIILRSAKELKGKVKEIKIDRIVYSDESNPDGPTIEINKGDVLMIIYENGQVFKLDDAPSSSSNTVQDSKSDKKEWDLNEQRNIASFFFVLPHVRFNPELQVLASRNNSNITGTQSVGAGVGVSFEHISKGGFGIKISPGFHQYEMRPGNNDSWVNTDIQNYANNQKSDDGNLNFDNSGNDYTTSNLVGGIGRIESSAEGYNNPSRSWSFSLPISPRWYVINKKHGQSFIGFEAAVGTVFKEKAVYYDDLVDGNTATYSSVSASFHLLGGGHIVPISHADIGVEAGIGYEYLRQMHGFAYQTQTSKVIYNNHQISFFLRFSLGGRF
jgi:hypothetical protein